jgi:hypothetical protein
MNRSGSRLHPEGGKKPDRTGLSNTNFIRPFPESDGYDYLWVIICRLSSMVHLIPVMMTTTASQLSPIFMKEIVRLHGLPGSIVCNKLRLDKSMIGCYRV